MESTLPYPKVGSKLIEWGAEATFMPTMEAFPSLGYLAAGHILIDHVLSTNRDDTLPHPILFSYRQYFELALKRQIALIHKYEGNDYDPRDDGHRLRVLWAKFRKLVAPKIEEWEGTPGIEVLGAVEGYVLELDELDRQGTLFRYAIGHPIGYKKQFNLSLTNLRERMQEAHNWFFSLYDWWEATFAPSTTTSVAQNREIKFGREQSRALTRAVGNLRTVVRTAIEQNLENRTVSATRLTSDDHLFNPFIDTYVVCALTVPVHSFFLDLGEDILREEIADHETKNACVVNKEQLYFSLSFLAIGCNDEIKALTYWELAQVEHQATHGTGTMGLNATIDALQSKFQSSLSGVALNFDSNDLLSILRSRHTCITDFDTTLRHLSGVERAHYLACGIRHLKVLHKLRMHPNREIAKVFAQELVNSLCLLSESMLKTKNYKGKTLAKLLGDVSKENPSIGATLGKPKDGSKAATGLFHTHAANFDSQHAAYLQNLESSTFDDDALTAYVLYAMYRLRNEALHGIDDQRTYYQDVAMFEKTIGLLFSSVPLILRLKAIP